MLTTVVRKIQAQDSGVKIGEGWGNSLRLAAWSRRTPMPTKNPPRIRVGSFQLRHFFICSESSTSCRGRSAKRRPGIAFRTFRNCEGLTVISAPVNKKAVPVTASQITPMSTKPLSHRDYRNCRFAEGSRGSGRARVLADQDSGGVYPAAHVFSDNGSEAALSSTNGARSQYKFR